MINKNKILVFGTGFISKNIFHFKPDSRDKIISISRDKSFQYSDHHYSIQLDKSIDIKKIIATEKIDKIYYFLGPSFPSVSNQTILNDIKTYLINFLKIVEYSCEYGIKQITLLSSAGTVYGSKSEKIFQEDTSLNLKNSYAIISKACENYLQLYSKKNDFNYKIFRLSNVFGIFHKNQHNGFINIVIRKNLKNDPIFLFNNTVKNYIFSEDLALIFWKLESLEKTNYTVNICSNDSFSLSGILKIIQNYFPRMIVKKSNNKYNYDTNPPTLDNNKLKSLIDFEFTPIEESVKKTIEWEKSNLK